MDIRSFTQEDLIWIKPIAIKYNEWEDIRDGIFHKNTWVVLSIWVIQGLAFVALFEDKQEPAKTYVCGLCDKRGIKAMFNLGRFICRLAQGFGMTLYSPELDEGSWQFSFFQKMGFKQIDSEHFVLPAED